MANNTKLVFKDLRSITNSGKREYFLKKFFNDFLKKFFPKKEQLDTLDTLSASLNPKESKFFEVVIHIVLAFKESTEEILGGIVFEFYHVSSFGLISYICVDDRYRNLKIGKKLIDVAEEELNSCAIQNSGKPCGAILLEMNSPYRVKEKDDSFSSQQRINVFKNLGCSLVEIDYVQPPLDTNLEPDTSLLLICINKDGKKNIDGEKLADFYKEFWETSCDDPSEYKQYYIDSICYAKEKKSIPLKPLSLDTIYDLEIKFHKRVEHQYPLKARFKSNL